MLSNQEGTSFQGRKLGRFHGFSFIVLHASHRLESCWRSPWLLPLASRVSSPDILECRDEFVTQRWRGMGQRKGGAPRDVSSLLATTFCYCLYVSYFFRQV